ncbi:unnamed protein product [Blepharisma stoltei]|uniref:Uncharacterized protein n=1 Tax=Blepharisma stoltei TaxID=1481888 RepID=A0AAU9IRQ3_9CILI|nr:unnamed protein product [Blepharisma stoltei]
MHAIQVKSFTFDALDEPRVKKASPLRKNFSKKTLNIPHSAKSSRQQNENHKKQLIYCSSEFMLNLLERKPSIPVSERLSNLNYRYVSLHAITPKHFTNSKPLKADFLLKSPVNIREQFTTFIRERPSTAKQRPATFQAQQRPKTAKVTVKPLNNPFSITKEKVEAITVAETKERKSDPSPIKRNRHEILRIDIKVPQFDNFDDDSEGEIISEYLSSFKYPEANN